MKIDDVRAKTDAELRFDRDALKKELFDLRFRAATEATSNPSRLREIRRAVARINTVLHERVASQGKESR